jgi:NAD(P)-dependent dehydrogenase (short-subunit alcohol dehydrogenase family)
MRNVNGQVVLITGAARGIGAELARVLASRGATLALVGLEPERQAALVRELGEQHTATACDVTNQEDLARAVAAAVDRHGRLDVVVANAGVAAFGMVSATPIDALARVIDVNLTGVVRTVSTTLPHVLRTRGYYLLVASAASFAAMPGLAAYCASKSGVEHFANALRYEVGPKGVGVGTIHPSWIDTDLVRDARADLPSFDRLLPRMPWPFNSVTSVRACAEEMVSAIERRRRRAYVPKALAPFSALRYLLVNPPFDFQIRRDAERVGPHIEQEGRALGRAFGRHSAALTGETNVSKVGD